jgi:hypothetical protein
MNCCTPQHNAPNTRRNHIVRGICAMLLVVGLSPAAMAQVNFRKFPDKALRGSFTMVEWPTILLDGLADKVSPGAKIYDERNMLVMPANLTGNAYLVNYTREISGMVHRVWILTPEEAAEKRSGAQPSSNITFASDANTTPVDDGKTPYNQLPRYGK